MVYYIGMLKYYQVITHGVGDFPQSFKNKSAEDILISYDYNNL